MAKQEYNVDLEHHAGIGLGPYWRLLQANPRKSLLKKLVTNSIAAGKNVIGIAAEERIPLRSWQPFDRRLEYLAEHSAEALEKEGYRVETLDLGDKPGIINVYLPNNHGRHPNLTLVRAQVLQPKPNKEGKMLKVLVFGGARYIESKLSLERALSEAEDARGIIVADNPADSGIDGYQAESIRLHRDSFHAIVGHDSQRSDDYNRQAKRIAREAGLQQVSVTNSHTPASKCGASIKVKLDAGVFQEGRNLVKVIGRAINSGEFYNNPEPESFFPKHAWKVPFLIGTRFDIHDKARKIGKRFKSRRK